VELVLGKKTIYKDRYDNSLLYRISRSIARSQLNISETLPFHGFDIWNCYELSWLDQNGKPVIKILELVVSVKSAYIVESKSLKLYLNSFNNSKFNDADQVKELIAKDLSALLESPVMVVIKDLDCYNGMMLQSFSGINLDLLAISIDNFDIHKNPPKLSEDKGQIAEILYSNLLKSNCLVTNQPDWASVQISYQGKQIDHSTLLKYLISFRNHNEFHEQCVERIFCDISHFCIPDKLTVYARYTRRGGVDINPIRSSHKLAITKISNLRHVRQ
jgi:7-cyano-7-deazaguanine reductase